MDNFIKYTLVKDTISAAAWHGSWCRVLGIEFRSAGTTQTSLRHRHIGLVCTQFCSHSMSKLMFFFFFIFVAGFGRSSRPNFSNDAMVAEKQLVRSIEEWRREMNIKEMNLVGHSMGGFLATSYTMSHPER